MAKHMMTAREVAQSILEHEHADVLHEAIRMVARELMEAEVAQLAKAELHERSQERTTFRNGYRERSWQTRVGDIDLQIPRLRSGPSYLPSFLEPRSRAESALIACVTEAYVNGVSTRKVTRICEQMGLTDINKDRVSRMCTSLDEMVSAFRERPLEGAHPYLWLDAKFEEVRAGARVRRKALVVAYAVHQCGRREVIGIDVGEAETEAFWTEFLRGLVARGLSGVKLCISDSHEGLKNAIARVVGSPWQRCTVHFMRNMLGHCSKNSAPLVIAAIRQIFAAQSSEEARQRLGEVVKRLKDLEPKVAMLLEAAEDEILTFFDFPKAHWRQIRSTNPIERVNREIGRRTDVVGIFPNDQALIRLAGAVLIEQNDEWLVGRRYMSEESLAGLIQEEEPARPRVVELPAA
jgi:transposase-like protein